MLKQLKLQRLHHSFPDRAIPDLRSSVIHELNAVWSKTAIKPEQTVAISVGSRGVANLSLMVRAICDTVKSHGAIPIIIPAMGSHGGGTAEGQREILAHYGVSEESMEAKVDAAMDVEQIGVTPEGMNVYVAKSALAADHIIVFNRVKPHTDFRGDIESGLCKIMAIGLGKISGATYYHRAITELGFANAITAAGRFVVANTKVALGLGVVEDAHDHTALVKALLPEELIEGEKTLLATAKSWLGRLPFMDVDCLVVDQMGKDISGAGMDTNITGRFRNLYSHFDLPEPRIKRIYARSLTPDSGGNATGMGRADFVSKKLYNDINFPFTYLNCRTGLGLENARLPLVCENDLEAFTFMKDSVGLIPEEKLRLVWIKDTLHLTDVVISGALAEECIGRQELTLGEKVDLDFDADGWLPHHVV